MGRSSGTITSSLDKGAGTVGDYGRAPVGQDEALKKMSKLVSSLLARNDAAPFAEPVDWRGLELWDYPKVIKKMMDLGTVKRKLDAWKYKTAAECAEDIRLVWTNCMTYNADGSDFYLLAEAFMKRFEDRYRRIKMEFDTGDDDEKDPIGREDSPPSLEVRTKFAANLFRLNGDELGYVLQVLDLRCPQVVNKVGSSNQELQVTNNPYKSVNTSSTGSLANDTEIEINVDAIDQKTFKDLDRFVRDKLYSRETSVPTSAAATSTAPVPVAMESVPKKKRRR